MSDVYLDIETAGLSWLNAEIAVIGIYLVNGSDSRLVQPVGKEVRLDNLLKIIDGVSTIYIYSDSCLDLPFIHGSLGVDPESVADHHDLMRDCWQCNLFGGFRALPARTPSCSGRDTGITAI